MPRRVDLGDAANLVPRADVELLENLVQVVLDRSRADEQSFADLPVRETISSEPGDLCFLWRERTGRVLGTFASSRAGRENLSLTRGEGGGGSGS